MWVLHKIFLNPRAIQVGAIYHPKWALTRLSVKYPFVQQTATKSICYNQYYSPGFQPLKHTYTDQKNKNPPLTPMRDSVKCNQPIPPFTQHLRLEFHSKPPSPQTHPGSAGSGSLGERGHYPGRTSPTLCQPRPQHRTHFPQSQGTHSVPKELSVKTLFRA